ncbi:MAG: hypothetical protein MUE53_09270 [Chitinophagales bacterium]|jgi:hypothetical protein|nr:hypothetical protein [Chitinophagales bacterium]
MDYNFYETLKIKSIYSEINSEEAEILSSACAHDETLARHLNQFDQITAQLNDIALKPRKKTIDNLLAFANKQASFGEIV